MTAPARTAGHRILVVEDEPAAREIVCEILHARGDSPRGAANVEEALAAIAEEEFCGFVLDQQLPVDGSPASKPQIAGGERVTLAARATDRRQTADGDDVTPIVALSGYSGHWKFVTGLHGLGITTFLEKPVSDHMELFLETLRGLFAKAGRGDHAKCAALSVRASVSGPTKVREEARGHAVRLAIDGKVTTSGRTGVVVNGTRREMQDSKFVPLLRCIVARERSLEAWSSREALGIGKSRNATTYIRESFEGLVPDGFQVIETDRRGNLRLNTEIVVESVQWDALAEHPDAGVVRIALERRKRRGDG